MTINILDHAPRIIAAPPAPAEPAPGFFRHAAPRSGGEQWGRALVLALGVQGALFALASVLSVLPGAQATRFEEREEPVVVFLAPAPPPRLGVPVAAPERAAPVRQARTPRPRSQALVAPVAPPQTPPPEAEAPVEEVETAAAPGGDDTSLSAVSGAVGASLGGVISGAGAVGGSLDGTGDAVVPVSQLRRPPEVLERVAPRYPPQLKRDGVEGTVVLRIVIRTDGSVDEERTQVMRSVPGLDEAAVASIHRWRFTPGIGQSGRPVRVVLDIPVRFALR